MRMGTRPGLKWDPEHWWRDWEERKPTSHQNSLKNAIQQFRLILAQKERDSDHIADPRTYPEPQ